MLAQKAEEFIQKVKNDNRISLIPFCEREWFRGAYSTIQRTLRGTYKPLDAKAKDKCSKFLTNGLLSISEKTFDMNLEKLILKLSEDFKISIGHSQKIISIFTKYAFCIFHAHYEELPQKWINFIEKHQAKLPVPIDAYVLFELRSNYEDRFKGIIKASRSKNYSPNSFICVNGEWTRWSKLSCIKTYKLLQKEIQNLAKNKEKKMMPLEFEIYDLWPTQRPK